MEKFKSLMLKLTLCTVILFSADLASAGFMQSWLKPFQGPGQNISILVVTGNYSKSRLLADLIQKNNNQPILLLPYAGANDQDVYFIPPQKSGSALKVPFKEMTNFINFVNPKMVLVLGGPNYVPDAYFKMIQNNRSIVRFTGDWLTVADSVGKMLNLSNLSSDYKNLLAQLDSDTNYNRQLQKESTAAPVVEATPVTQETIVDTAPVELQPRVIDASVK